MALYFVDKVREKRWARFMKFPKQRRVRKRPEFQEIQKSGRRVSTNHFVWIISRHGDPARPSRLGITASKKFGNSVHRSRVKRVVREAFRELRGMLPSGHDLVVICRTEPVGLSTAFVVAEWQASLKRIDKVLRQLQSAEPRPAPSKPIPAERPR